MHYGRVSKPGALYFVTLCTEGRQHLLSNNETSERIFSQWETQSSEGDIELSCAVIMPDHLHVLFRLGTRLKLGRVIAKFKAKLGRSVLWQDDFYDHMLRSEESEEQFGFYVFMNPYNDKLLPFDRQWKYWKRWREAEYRFEELLRENGGIVPTQWLKWVHNSEFM